MAGATQEQLPFKGTARFPCDKMKGTVVVRDPTSFREIHILALKFILDDGTVSGVLKAFGLGSEVMQEVLADLVFAGLIRIDMDADRAVVAEPHAGILREGRVKELEGRLYKTRAVEVTWILDRITGEVFADRELDRYTRLPKEPGDFIGVNATSADVTELKRIRNTILARAAIGALSDGDEDFDISLVEQIEDKRMLPGNTLYIPIRSRLVPGTELEYYVVDAPGVALHVRDNWEKLLNHARVPLDVRPPATAMAEYRSPAAVCEDALSTIDELDQLLQFNVRSFEVSDRGEILIGRLQAACKEADQLELAEGNTRVAHGERKKQWEFLSREIAAATTQVIIGSAFATRAGVSALLPHLRDALQRGVSVALIQGLPLDHDPESPVRAADQREEILQLLRTSQSKSSGTVNFYSSRRPFHSKFVLVDGALAVISSYNWLSGAPHGGPREASISFDARRPVVDVATQVLEYLPTDAPEGAQLEILLRKTRRLDTREHRFKRTSAKVAEAWEDLMSGPSSASIAAMRVITGQARLSLERIAELKPTQVVFTGQHRAMLFDLMARAKHKLLISSDRVSPLAAGPQFAGALNNVLNRKVDVELRWGRQARPGPETAESEKAVKQLQERLLPAGSLSLPTQPSNNHAKVIVVDEACAVISSFNFLSFGAMERSGQILADELGVITYDSQVIRSIGNSR